MFNLPTSKPSWSCYRVYVSRNSRDPIPNHSSWFSGQVKNLEERIKIEQLKEALTEIFSEYGNVIDLVAKRNLKAKGQAFVVFDDVKAAELAIKEVQGFELFEKPMILDYAKTPSDATVKREGNHDEFDSHRRRRLAEKGKYLIHRQRELRTD